MHRIPVTPAGQERDEPTSKRASLEGGYEEQQLFVPADTHANTIFDTEGCRSSNFYLTCTLTILRIPGAESHVWQSEAARTTHPEHSRAEPAVNVNGTSVSRDATPVQGIQRPNMRDVEEVSGTDADDEDEDRKSLEDTTGSITSVD